MTLLNIFCPECTPYLLLMLAGAWILGWLFWKMFKESGYVTNIKNLENEVSRVKQKNTDLSTEITQANYRVEKTETENNKLRTKIGDMDIQYRAKNEEFNQLTESYEQLKADYEATK